MSTVLQDLVRRLIHNGVIEYDTRRSGGPVLLSTCPYAGHNPDADVEIVELSANEARVIESLLGYRPPGAAPFPVEGMGRIVAERTRQVTEEEWSPEHDDRWENGELAVASYCYSAVAAFQQQGLPGAKERPAAWPWAAEWWKPSDDPIRNLEKAGALAAAEIDRIRRATREPTVPPASTVPTTQPDGEARP